MHDALRFARTSISQMVHVVSMLLVPKCLGSASHQSKEVRGAQKSLCLFCGHVHTYLCMCVYVYVCVRVRACVIALVRACMHVCFLVFMVWL